MTDNHKPRPLSGMEAVDAEREWVLYCGSDNTIDPNDQRAKHAFMYAVEFGLRMLDKAKAREGFEQERFKRAWILARQMSTVSAQSVLVLNNIRKRLIVGTDGKPVDTLGIGKTIETIAAALKSADKVLEILKAVQPDASGNPVLPKLPEVGGN